MWCKINVNTFHFGRRWRDCQTETRRPSCTRRGPHTSSSTTAPQVCISVSLLVLSPAFGSHFSPEKFCAVGLYFSFLLVPRHWCVHFNYTFLDVLVSGVSNKRHNRCIIMHKMSTFGNCTIRWRGFCYLQYFLCLLTAGLNCGMPHEK